MRMSLSPHFQMKIYTHRTKNDLTAWAPIRLEGPNKIRGPGNDLRTPWKVFSLRPWSPVLSQSWLLQIESYLPVSID